MSQHLALIALVVPDYDEGLDFYVTTMGFDLIEDSDQGNGKRWVVVAPPGGQTRLLLARAVNDEQRSRIGNQTGGRVFLFLHTNYFEADHARMLKAGVIFEEPPRVEPYGKVAVFRDPFGNRWDLLQLVAAHETE